MNLFRLSGLALVVLASAVSCTTSGGAGKRADVAIPNALTCEGSIGTALITSDIGVGRVLRPEPYPHASAMSILNENWFSTVCPVEMSDKAAEPDCVYAPDKLSLTGTSMRIDKVAAGKFRLNLWKIDGSDVASAILAPYYFDNKTNTEKIADAGHPIDYLRGSDDTRIYFVYFRNSLHSDPRFLPKEYQLEIYYRQNHNCDAHMPSNGVVDGYVDDGTKEGGVGAGHEPPPH
jgi:hypothetical protein